jgi:hypothetical protein
MFGSIVQSRNPLEFFMANPTLASIAFFALIGARLLLLFVLPGLLLFSLVKAATFRGASGIGSRNGIECSGDETEPRMR